MPRTYKNNDGFRPEAPALKRSVKRELILKVMEGSGQHLTADRIHALAREKNPKLGVATVYRTLKLFCKMGIAREIMPEDGTCRYELAENKGHHDHLICLGCGAFIEAVDPEIEKLQNRLAARHGFQPQRHKLEIYGFCAACRRRQP